MGKYGRVKGAACKSSIVVNIKQLKEDWEHKTPSIKERELDCRLHGFSYTSFAAQCTPSKLKNGCRTVKISTYFRWVEAAGLDVNKYECKDLNPKDYIYRKPETSTPINSIPENVAVTNVPEPTPALIVDQDVQVVKFEFPTPTKKSNTKPARLNNHSISDSKLNKPANSNTYVRVVKKDDLSRRKVMSVNHKITKLNESMNSFVSHLSIYLCSLNVTIEGATKDTSITRLPDIVSGKSSIQFYEYMILSQYLINLYNAEDTPENVKVNFDTIAKCFKDIYMNTLYYGDASSNT